MNFLPLEILLEIFKFLQPDKNIPLVCKKFNFAYQKDILWDIYLQRDFCIQDKTPREKYIEYYKFYVIQKWFKKHGEKYTFEKLMNLETLYLNYKDGKILLGEIGTLTKLELINYIIVRMKVYQKKLRN